jgi:hypothetical protein
MEHTVDESEFPAAADLGLRPRFCFGGASGTSTYSCESKLSFFFFCDDCFFGGIANQQIERNCTNFLFFLLHVLKGT